jgi:hypothetical protein
MRNIIYILFLFASLPLSATNYYVKNGGSDGAAGTSDGTAWASISKVNSMSFSPGDSIFFNRGDRFEGVLTPPSNGASGNHIVFGAYGTGAKPILTPNTEFTGTWTLYQDSIWRADLGDNPINVLINGTTKINKINDYWMTNSMNWVYDALTPKQLLAVNVTKKFSVWASTGAPDFYFWDGLDALYCYDAVTDSTYLRFRNGENPNDSTFYVSYGPSSGSTSEVVAVNITSKRYITLQNLNIVGGREGIYVKGCLYPGSDNIIIEDCKIENSNRKIYIWDSSGVIVRRDTMINYYLSDYNPGAYDGGTTYTHAVKAHYYQFFKFRVGQSTSSEVDCGLQQRGTTQNNSLYDNVSLNCTNGIQGYGSNNQIYRNHIQGGSSVGTVVGQSADNTNIYENTYIDFNLPLRFQYIDAGSPRTNYVYKNKIYNPTAGFFLYLHYYPGGPSVITAYIYNNSVCTWKGIDVSSNGDDNPPNGTGAIFLNNIISAEYWASGQYGWVDDYDWMWDFKYNIVGGGRLTATNYSSAAWFDTDYNTLLDTLFWDSSSLPDFTDIGGSIAVDSGIRVHQTFGIDGNSYPQLPGYYLSSYTDSADIGAYEYDAPATQEPPTVTSQLSSFTSTSALAGGNVTDNGGASVTARGVCWNTTGTPTTSDSKTTDGTGTGAYTSNLTSLTAETTYYMRSYATNSEGTGYGLEIEFTTPSAIYGGDGVTGHGVSGGKIAVVGSKRGVVR